jgi:hypothetical protein
MRGKFIHNNVILGTLVLALSLLGYQVFVEHPVRAGQRPPSVDAFFVVRDKRVVLEAERSTARIPNDVAKAKQLGADLLLIIVPNARLQARVQAALTRLGHDSTRAGLQIRVMTLGAALQWVAHNCPLVSAPYDTSDIKTPNQIPH